MAADRPEWLDRVTMADFPEFAGIDVAKLTPGERVELCWALTEAAWKRHAPEALEGGFRRDVVRVIRLPKARQA
jgi:hypothetical protein